MDKKGKNIKTSARADAKRHINNNAPVSAERKRAQQARSAEQARAALKAQQEAKQKQAKAQAAQRKRANAAPVQQPKKNTARPAAIKQQPGTAKKKKTKKKYKINYKKFCTFIAGVVAIIVLLIVLLHAIFGGGSKKGWYGVYVSPSKDAKIGVVTELTKKGLPKNVEYAKEVSKGVYEIPIQYGGTSTVIVANKNYSFNRVNTNDTEYYLVSIQAKVSDDSESQKAFEAKHEPEIIKANEKKVSTTSSNKLPDLNVYKDTKGKKTLATISVGSPQPSYDVDELNYISKKRPTPPAKKDEVTSFTFSASGDNLIHQRLYQQASARTGGNGYNFDYCYEDVADFYQNHDLNWFNQESLLNNKFEPDSYPTFSTPGADGESLYNILNARIFSTANNHSYDKGAAGIEASVDYYQNDLPNDILATGFFERDNLYDIPVYTCEGRSIAFLSYTYGTNGNSIPSDSKYRVVYTDELDVIEKQVKKANKLADIVIVGCHWGTEDSHVIAESQKSLAQNLANWGADLIIGTHPHVVQNAEWIKASDGRRVFCAYSLGNFLSTQAAPDELVGLVLDCTFKTTITADGDVSVEVQNPQLIPTVTVYGIDAANTHVVWLSNYSEMQAAKHGVVISSPSFSYSYIISMLQRYVDDSFLVLPKGVNKSSEETTSESTTTASSTSSSTTESKTSALSTNTGVGAGREGSGPVGLAAVGA